MTRQKNGYRRKVLESLVNGDGVTAVTNVTGGLDGHDVRACVRACVGACVCVDRVSGYSGYSGYTSENNASEKREAAVTTFPRGAAENGYSGYALADLEAPLTDRPSIDAALRLPVRAIAWLPARLTYRFQRPDGTQVAWTSHPGVYGALAGSEGPGAPAGAERVAAFSPKEFEAATAAGESGVATERDFAAWVAQKLAAPKWRLSAEEALRWGPRGRLAGFGWWPGGEWCDGHDIGREYGWTVALATAVFGLTPVSVQVHAAEPAVESNPQPDRPHA